MNIFNNIFFYWIYQPKFCRRYSQRFPVNKKLIFKNIITILTRNIKSLSTNSISEKKQHNKTTRKFTLSIWINNQILKFSPGKGKHTEMKILKWHALKARLKFLLQYGWFSNYELDIPLSYVPLSHEGPIQSAAHPLSHRPVTWLQAAFSLQLFAHDSVQFFPNHPSLHSTYIRTQYF